MLLQRGHWVIWACEEWRRTGAACGEGRWRSGSRGVERTRGGWLRSSRGNGGSERMGLADLWMCADSCVFEGIVSYCGD